MATAGGRGRPPLQKTLDPVEQRERACVYALRRKGAQACRELRKRSRLTYKGVADAISDLLSEIAEEVGPDADVATLAVDEQVVRGTEECPSWNGTGLAPPAGIPHSLDKDKKKEMYVLALIYVCPGEGNGPPWLAAQGLAIAAWWAYPWGLDAITAIQEPSRQLTLAPFKQLVRTKLTQIVRVGT